MMTVIKSLTVTKYIKIALMVLVKINWFLKIIKSLSCSALKVSKNSLNYFISALSQNQYYVNHLFTIIGLLANTLDQLRQYKYYYKYPIIIIRQYWLTI